MIIAVWALYSAANDKRLAYDLQILQRVYELLGRLEAFVRELRRSDVDLGLRDPRARATIGSFDLELTALTARLARRDRYELLLAYQEYLSNASKPEDEVMKLYSVPLQSNPIPVNYYLRETLRDQFDAMAIKVAPLIDRSSALTQDGSVRWKNAVSDRPRPWPPRSRPRIRKGEHAERSGGVEPTAQLCQPKNPVNQPRAGLTALRCGRCPGDRPRRQASPRRQPAMQRG